MINWENIKERILSNTKSTFYEGNPSISEDRILDGINLFRKVILPLAPARLYRVGIQVKLIELIINSVETINYSNATRCNRAAA